MEICKHCGNNVIPAGISKKTGKPYDSFCSNDKCVTRQRAEKPKKQPIGMVTDKQYESMMSLLETINKKLDLLTQDENGLKDNATEPVDWGQ